MTTNYELCERKTKKTVILYLVITYERLVELLSKQLCIDFWWNTTHVTIRLGSTNLKIGTSLIFIPIWTKFLIGG